MKGVNRAAAQTKPSLRITPVFNRLIFEFVAIMGRTAPGNDEDGGLVGGNLFNR
jgi:hypothetical protein